jgi:hypothetical protein
LSPRHGGSASAARHQVAAAGINEQPNLFTSDHHPDRHKRPHKLQRRNSVFACLGGKCQYAVLIVDAEARPRQHVEADDRVDADVGQVREIADDDGHGARLQRADVESVEHCALDRHLLAERDKLP